MATPTKRITFGDFSMPRYTHKPPSVENIVEEYMAEQTEYEEEEIQDDMTAPDKMMPDKEEF